jgi:shikimate kinase
MDPSGLSANFVCSAGLINIVHHFSHGVGAAFGFDVDIGARSALKIVARGGDKEDRSAAA